MPWSLFMHHKVMAAQFQKKWHLDILSANAEEKQITKFRWLCKGAGSDFWKNSIRQAITSILFDVWRTNWTACLSHCCNKSGVNVWQTFVCSDLNAAINKTDYHLLLFLIIFIFLLDLIPPNSFWPTWSSSSVSHHILFRF